MNRRAYLTLAVLATLGSTAGCSYATSMAPPLVVCGTTLSNSASGAVLTDASAGPATVHEASSGGDIYLRVAAGCHTGARLTFAPSSAATVVTTARSDDGQPAAVVIHPNAAQFTVSVHRHGGAVDQVLVDLRPPA